MLNIREFANTGRLFDGHYALIRPLSVDGATADVWLALDVNTVTESAQLTEIANISDDEAERLGLIVAIKIYRPQNALDIEGEQRFRDEYMIVFNCHHENLIHPTHFSIFQETPYLVLPYCKLGSSEGLIGHKLNDESIWKYILDVSSGLAYLHSLEPPIIHQDIKPANILLDDTHHYSITDFGISAQKGGMHGSYYDEENSGTLAYMAPERFQESAMPIPQSDIWALGATLYEILTGNVPFGEEGGKAQIESNLPIPEIRGLSSDIQRLIRACLLRDPQKRPSAAQIMKAAEVQQYPIRGVGKWLITTIIMLFCVVAVGVWAYLSQFKDLDIEQNPPLPSTEELYDSAYSQLNSDNVEIVQEGLNLMDSLSHGNYIPAIYQMAFTYGWYSDSLSVKRKRLLDIDVYMDGEKKYLPLSDTYSDQAVALFTRILDLNDSIYADINADAAYRLGCYYINPNGRYTKNYVKGKQCMLHSRAWAEMVNDTVLVEKIDNTLERIEKYEKSLKR